MQKWVDTLLAGLEGVAISIYTDITSVTPYKRIYQLLIPNYRYCVKCPFYRTNSIEIIVNILELVDEMMCLETPNKALTVLFRNSACVKDIAEKTARKLWIVVADLNTILSSS